MIDLSQLIRKKKNINQNKKIIIPEGKLIVIVNMSSSIKIRKHNCFPEHHTKAIKNVKQKELPMIIDGYAEITPNKNSSFSYLITSEKELKKYVA